MNLKDLQIKIADVLGVSNSQKELAFDTFIDKIYESLHEGLTLKLPRIGFFQLKAPDFHNGPSRSIIYSSLSEDFDRDSRNLYLTIDVSSKSKSSTDLDSNVFSIGVGKPLLPLASDDMPDSETSYAMLKKSIEERAKELISESDQIPNFDIFEGYLEVNDEPRSEEQDIRFTLSNLTSDLDIVHVEEPDTSPAPPDDEDLLTSLVGDSSGIEDSNKEQEQEFTRRGEHEQEDFTRRSFNVDGYEQESENKILPTEARSFNDNAGLSAEAHSSNNKAGIPAEAGSLSEGGEESKSIHEDEIDEQLYSKEQFNEQLPEISLAELLGSTISDTDDIKVEKPVETEPVEPSLSISEFLLRDDSTSIEQEEKSSHENIEQPPVDTVNIETFLKEDGPVEPGIEFSDEDELIDLLLPGADLEEEKVSEKLKLEDEPENIDDLKEKIVEEEFGLNVNELPTEKHEQKLEQAISNMPDQDEEKIDLKKDIFAELDEDIERLKITAESEGEDINPNSLLKDNDFGEKEEEDFWLEESGTGEEKVEWNWGDELKEEFGVTRFEGEDANFEMVDDKDAEDHDQPITDNKLYKDLFAQLEKTIEKEKTIFKDDVKSDDWKVEDREETQPKFPAKEEKRETKFSFKDDEKVYLEFSNPPSKYEFVAAQQPERSKRMSIALEDQPKESFEHKRTYTGAVPPKTEKDNYFGKIFILIFSAFVIISASIYFLLRNNSLPKENGAGNSVVAKRNPEQSVVDSIIQSHVQDSANDTTRSGFDDLGSFPTTATPPVPIKSGSIEGIADKNIERKNSPAEKTVDKTPVKKKPTNEAVPDENSLYRSLATDTRVSKTIYYDGTSYNFQTSSWRNKDKAEQEVKRLHRLGFKAFIVTAYLPQKGGTWYRVRIGSFGSQQEAQDFILKNNF